MTAQPVQNKARKATRAAKSKHLVSVEAASTTDLAAVEAAEKADLIRWDAEYVVKEKLLPYRSARVLREKCYKRQVFHHNDGGRITFSPMSIRAEHARTLVAPLAA
ncbi:MULTISPECIES: hypothetical protein [Streptomyces]|uniref:Uncharacterized protein n=1 Tax=Streptomyces venezuelae (strain ATCC 10712 / CBS 650.69 / DSM 40230 / JCM 4526 / NBRC 13096 / PD 04745) TaxID=953739 RepID=F2RKW9_STRVP|nr:hypothetical protein [Streptomyces venezuelae]APE21340.1 hypothetical protein vnz_10130 [Streptomyces venezuelae]QER98730.1 hypothetical protein DEJ43_10255 [Streptomyces venezuelae ATCC 10712]CCA55358.1 hypothetical protein SVEN_2072 [Streptomyces venezuelae ATCC 10712]